MNEQLFQVGDVVSCPRWCKMGQSGKVSRIGTSKKFPVIVTFEFRPDEEFGYTFDGRYGEDLPPTLQHGPMNNYTPNHVRPTPPFPERGTPILVSDNMITWVIRLADFVRYDGWVSVICTVNNDGSVVTAPFRYWLPFDAIKIDQE